MMCKNTNYENVNGLNVNDFIYISPKGVWKCILFCQYETPDGVICGDGEIR